MHTSASELPGSEGRCGGMPRARHQYDTSPLCIIHLSLTFLAMASDPPSYQAFPATGRVASEYATWGAGRGLEHGPPARGGCLPRGTAHASLLAQDRTHA